MNYNHFLASIEPNQPGLDNLLFVKCKKCKVIFYSLLQSKISENSPQLVQRANYTFNESYIVYSVYPLKYPKLSIAEEYRFFYVLVLAHDSSLAENQAIGLKIDL
jgi:hypothetical protein